MTTFTHKRRLLLGAAALGVVLLVLALVLRLTLTRLAVDALLQMAGASEIKFQVTQASPWQVVMENLDFSVRTQSFAAKRIVFQRTHWWTLSLGRVRVEQVRVPVTIDGSDANPWAWATYKGGKTSAATLRLPLEEISLDGELVIRATALPEQTLAVKIAARLAGPGKWTGAVQAAGPGLDLKAEGTFDLASNELAFKVPAVSLDLKPWQNFVQRLVLLPGGSWELAGELTGSAEGRRAGKKLVAGGRVQLRDGRMRNELRGVAAEGIEADLEFTDFDKFQTKPGLLRIRELVTGKLALRDLAAEAAFENAEKIVVTHASLKALGGGVTAEPFKYFFNLRELEAVLLMDGIDVAEVMALTQDVPATATGRVSGRLPVHLDSSGLRLGTGWLELTPGVRAEVRFNATGLLTNGVAPKSPSYPVLKKIESGLLKLQVGKMRLDIRPLDAPAGRSAQLHLEGAPVDPEVRAPVTLDLNVNGPLEKLLNLSLDSRVSFGGKP